MATVGRATLTAITTGVLLLPLVLIVLLQGPSVSPTHAFPVDDFGDGIRVTFDPETSTNVSSVVDDLGNMHVVWEDYRSGNGDIYYVKLDPEGNKLTNDAKISNDAAPSMHPAVTVDSTDHVYVVWEEYENASWELLFAKLWYWDGNITFQENGLQVSDSDPADSTEPDIAVEAEGGLSLVWTDARNDIGDGNLEIYYKRLDERGFSLTADIRVTRDPGLSEHPRIDLDAANDVHLTWYDFRDSDDGIVVNHGVFYKKLTVDGIMETVERRVTFASPASRPDIAVDTDGNVHVVFDDDRYASFDIFYTLLDNTGITIEDDVNISPKDETESRVPRVELSDSNAIDVVWQDNSSGAWAIHYSAMAYDGSLEVYDQPMTGDGFYNATQPIVMCAKDNNSLVLFIGDVGNQEVFFQRTHRPNPAVYAGEVSLSSTQPLEESYMWVNATVRNLEGDTIPSLVVRLLVDGVTVNETAVPSLAGGTGRVVSFRHLTSAGETQVTVQVDPDDSVRETEERDNEVSVDYVVRTLGVSLVCDAVSAQAEPGTNVTFNATITNEGSSEYAFLLTATGLEEGWDVDLGGSPEGRFTVAPGGSITAQVNVSVPDGIPPGPRMLALEVECEERESVNDTVPLMVDVERVGNVTVSAPGGETVEPTMTYTYRFIVSNDANENETFAIEVTDQRGWELVSSADSVELVPGVPCEVTVTVIPSRYDPPGTTDILTLSAVSQNLSGNDASGSALLTTGTHRELHVSLAGQAFVNYSVAQDRQVIYYIDVSNLGNADEVTRLGLEGIDSFWAVLGTVYVPLGPGETTRVQLTMTPGATVLAGVHEFNLTAVLENDPDVNVTLPMGVSILAYYDLAVSLESEEIHVSPGETVFVNITVENWGNIIDGVDLYLYTDVFNTTTVILEGQEYDLMNDSLPSVMLDPGQSVTFTLKVPVPSQGAEEGIHELYADFASVSDPSASESAAFWIVVIVEEEGFPLWMILAIAGGAGAGAFVIFLFLRARAQRAAAEEEEERRKTQKKPASAKPAKKPA